MAAEFNPATVMIAELTRRMNAVPFTPFIVVTSSGRTHEVPTSDHLTITRLLREVFVESDDCRIASVNPLHISSLEPLAGEAR